MTGWQQWQSCWRRSIFSTTFSYTGSAESRMGPVAQRLEQQTHNLLVLGSNPSGPTRRRTIDRVSRHLALGSISCQPLNRIPSFAAAGHTSRRSKSAGSVVQRAFGEDKSETSGRSHRSFPSRITATRETAFLTWRCGLGSLSRDLRNRLAMNRFRAFGLMAARLHETEL
jgi:hypothetical protein